jgi:putative ABC transport system permease protein
MAVCVAVVGVANTVGLSVVERTRELGLLRAIGATRTQVRRLVTLEAVALALLGTVLGEILGAASGYLYIRGSDPEADLTVVFPAGLMTLLLAGGVLVGLLAAVLPARRAATLDVLAAVAAP